MYIYVYMDAYIFIFIYLCVYIYFYVPALGKQERVPNYIQGVFVYMYK